MLRRLGPLFQTETETLVEGVAAAGYPLAEDGDLDPLLDRIGEARYVLLGEASHGTSDYYTWRARISRRLIEEKGFSFISSPKGRRCPRPIRGSSRRARGPADA